MSLNSIKKGSKFSTVEKYVHAHTCRCVLHVLLLMRSAGSHVR